MTNAIFFWKDKHEFIDFIKNGNKIDSIKFLWCQAL